MDEVTNFNQGPETIMPANLSQESTKVVLKKGWFKKPLVWILLLLILVLALALFFIFFEDDLDITDANFGANAEEIGIAGADGINYDEEIHPDDLTGLYGYVGDDEGLEEVSLNLSCDSNLYNCGDFESCEEVMVVFDACEEDVHSLDKNDDGIPCESLCTGA
jgi:hypothetical protein